MVDQADATLTGKESFRVELCRVAIADRRQQCPNPVTTTTWQARLSLRENDSSGTKDKTQAVERPLDVHLRTVAVDVINGGGRW